MYGICGWGCGNEATLPPTKYSKGGRCTDRVYDCPGYKSNHKKNLSPWNKGKTVHTDDRIRKLSDSAKGKRRGFSRYGMKHSDETKLLISSKMMGNNNYRHRRDRQFFYKDIRMDSSWEVGVARYFDDNDIVWTHNEKGYLLSTGSYYYPDFHIYEDGNFVKLVEVKGYFRDNNKKKFLMFKEEYPNIEIELWNKDVLLEKDIINSAGYIKGR